MLFVFLRDESRAARNKLRGYQVTVTWIAAGFPAPRSPPKADEVGSPHPAGFNLPWLERHRLHRLLLKFRRGRQ